MPTLSTGFFGREAEVAAACAMRRHEETRLATFTGPGGVGNTRLAGAVATVMAADMPDGGRYVELAGVRDPALVTPEIARATSGRDANAGRGIEAAAAAFQHLECLIILDNFEHVVDAASLLTDLLAVCLGVTVLATSRTTL